MTPQQKALKDCIEALELADNIALVGSAYTPKSIDVGLRKIRDAITQAKQALDHVPDAWKMVQAQVEQDRESERAAFEADAEPLGFDLLRVANPNVEPWDDYLEMETGMRWGGWLARAAHPQASEPAGWKLVPV